MVEGNYFNAMRIPLVAGRRFDRSDLAGTTPVMIVNREFVRQYLSTTQPLGTQVIPYFDFSDGRPRTIVGVVANVQSASLDAAIKPQVYVPEQQMPYPGLRIVIRTKAGTDPLAALPLLKRELRALDPSVAVAEARRIDAIFAESLARQKFSMTIMGVFAVSAIVLAMVGLYGVIALSVGQRRREIGVRMAVGARSFDVLRLMLVEGLRITGAGLAIGVAGAVAASRVMTAMLFGVSATNIAVYASAITTIALVTLAATLVPARRATRVDPTLALRAE